MRFNILIKNVTTLHIKLHTENFDANLLSGLKAGQLSALLQLASMLILNIDYGIAPKTK